MPLGAALVPGAMVIAADSFDPIIRGQLGMITGCIRGSWLPWRRAAYVCTFLGGISVIATRRQIIVRDHGCSRLMLEDPLWFLHTRNTPVRSGDFAAGLPRSTH